MEEDLLRIEYIPLEEIQRWPRNPKKHDMGALVAAIERYGFVDPPKYDTALGALVYGNGRDEALEWMRAQGRPAPRGIRVDETGRWLVPIRFGVDAPSLVEAESLAIDHNNLTMSGGDFTAFDMARMWDAGYAELLEGLRIDDALPLTLDDDALASLLVGVGEPDAGGGDEFDTTPPEGPTRTALGDLWSISGNGLTHRLIVGDCTDPLVVERLMGGERADACIMDSPYGISREGIENDDEGGLYELFAGCLKCLPISSGVVVNFQSPRLFPLWLDAIRQAGHKFERMLWMYKSNDETFPWRGWLLKSEAILVSTVGKGQWQDVHPYTHDCYSPTTIGKELPEGSGWHASVKPIEVVADLVKRTSPPSGIVYDGFLGSGTTLIAAHRTGRRCYGCEIEPRYADVILRRVEAEGLTCVLATGLTCTRVRE